MNLGLRCINFRFAACFTTQKRSGDMSDLFWLTDPQMARMVPFFTKVAQQATR